MQSINPNNVKIYNLTAQKSVPEWLPERRRRKLLQKDVELRRRVDLVQDLEMPSVSSVVGMTSDQQYIYAAGAYKPRVKFFDINQMSLKFERCVDHEVVKMKMLSEDYSKFVLLETERYIEIHNQQGRWYRLRIPKCGRDIEYHQQSCDLYLAAAGSEVYRLNLEQGHFMPSIQTDASEVLCCRLNNHHQLLTLGTKEGKVECWDPRTNKRAGLLDCCVPEITEDFSNEFSIPSVTTLTYKDHVHLGVGTSTGHVILYDIRSCRPYQIKDHKFELPINTVTFCEDQRLVMSSDSRIVKLWNEDSGKPFTAVEPGVTINSTVLLPGSGLMFMANESPKIQVYYIPSLGPAPKWCSFLDSMTEELEEKESTNSIYDNYKFVTRNELEALGLSNLVGTKMLRAYMHGYFMDANLYKKTKSLTEQFSFEDYKKTKIREKIEEERKNQVQKKKLPSVNRALAERLEQQTKASSVKTRKQAESLLKDDRFSVMFRDSAYQVDTESTEYRLLSAVVGKLDKTKVQEPTEEGSEVEDQEGQGSSDEESSESSSDDEHTWTENLKKAYKEIKYQKSSRRREEEAEPSDSHRPIRRGETTKSVDGKLRKIRHVEISEEPKEDAVKRKMLKKSLADRLGETFTERAAGGLFGNKEMTFTRKQPSKAVKRLQEQQEHRQERKKIRRSAGALLKKKVPPKFWRK